MSVFYIANAESRVDRDEVEFDLELKRLCNELSAGYIRSTGRPV